MIRNLDARFERSARDREILQTALHERHDLVAPRLRLHGARVLAVPIEERLFVFRESEKKRRLFHLLDRRVRARRAEQTLRRLLELLLRVVRLATDAVEALVRSFVDVAVLLSAAPEILHPIDVTLLGRAYEIVVLAD